MNSKVRNLNNGWCGFPFLYISVAIKIYRKETHIARKEIIILKLVANKIYKKETHTNRYLNYKSCHLQQQKQDIIMSLLSRASKLIRN